MLVHVNTTHPYDTDSNLPISVANQKIRMRVTHNAEDDFIKECIKTATILIESEIRRSLVEQTHVLTIDQLRDELNTWELFIGSNAIIYLANPPVLSVTSIVITDSEGNNTTVASSNYYVDLNQGRILPINGYTWQTAQRDINAVTITYKSGYVADTLGSTLNPTLITAVSMLATYLYDNRMGECELPQTVRKMVGKFKLSRLGNPYMGLGFNTQVIRSGSVGGY